MRYLADAGYTDEIRLVAGGLECDASRRVRRLQGRGRPHVPVRGRRAIPGDEAIVLGISLPDWGVKGVFMSAYGPTSSPTQAEVLRALVH